MQEVTEMAADTRVRRQSYIAGSTAHAVQPQRVYEEPARRADRRPAVSHTVRRNQEKALHMDLPYVVVLTIAAACVLSICVNYLHVRSSISYRIAHIESLEKQLEQLKAENDALQTAINTNVDLNHVYQVATQELGMVYANRDQVLLYDKTESEYVRQYEDIPRH